MNDIILELKSNSNGNLPYMQLSWDWQMKLYSMNVKKNHILLQFTSNKKYNTDYKILSENFFVAKQFEHCFQYESIIARFIKFIHI